MAMAAAILAGTETVTDERGRAHTAYHIVVPAANTVQPRLTLTMVDVHAAAQVELPTGLRTQETVVKVDRSEIMLKHAGGPNDIRPITRHAHCQRANTLEY